MDDQVTFSPEALFVRAKKRQRLRIVLIVVPLLLGSAILLWPEFFFELSRPLRINLLWAVVVLFMASASGLLMLYLQTGFRRVTIPETFTRIQETAATRQAKEQSIALQEVSQLKTELENLKAKLEAFDSANILTDQQRAELTETLKRKLTTERTRNILSDFRAQIEASVVDNARRDDISAIFAKTLERLNLEISALGRRGNTNLTIGIITTLAGLVVLAELVFKANLNPKNTLDLSAHYLPRITLVVFIEIFAYFFLKLYKASLSEIKYFQNEMTNVEAKFAALQMSLDKENKGARADIIKSLGHTERNSILKKGETTAELERVKLDKDAFTEIVPKLVGVFKANQK